MKVPRRSLACVVIAIALVMAATLPGRAAAKWIKLTTAHFVFIGDASERVIRQVAQHLEQFRDILSTALPAGAVESSIPTIVFVFQSDKSFTPYKPHFQGHPIEVAGYFQASNDVNYVTINPQLEGQALKIVFHEYTHLLVRNTTGNIPAWANEGLAGVYETFEDRSGGKSAMIGIPNRDHLRLLQSNRLMPLEELLAIDHESPVYNEGDRRGMFYAESWALMHYLMLGSDTRRPQLLAYLGGLRKGMPADQAFKSAFGDDLDALERELREYIARFGFPVLTLEFSEKVNGSGAGKGEPIDEAEATAYLGDLLDRMGRHEDARAQLKELMDANPRSSRAAGALGLLEIRAGNLDTALPLLERATALDPTDGVAYRNWGRALFDRAQEETQEDGKGTDSLQQARSALERTVELLPRDPEALALLGRLETMAGTDPARASALLERAVALVPGDERYRMMLAEALVRQGEYARATTVLVPLMDAATRDDIREAARDLLTYVANRSRSTRSDRTSSAGGTAMTPASAPSSPRPNETTLVRFIPELRPLGPDEKRVLGLFAAVECVPGSVVLRISGETQLFRLATASLANVEFISYRDTAPGNVDCGALQPPARVLATYRDADNTASGSGIDGHAVAIELLPDGYTPK